MDESDDALITWGIWGGGSLLCGFFILVSNHGLKAVDEGGAVKVAYFFITCYAAVNIVASLCVLAFYIRRKYWTPPIPSDHPDYILYDGLEAFILVAEHVVFMLVSLSACFIGVICDLASLQEKTSGTHESIVIYSWILFLCVAMLIAQSVYWYFTYRDVRSIARARAADNPYSQLPQ